MCDCIYLPMSARIKECKGNVCMTSGSLVGCPQSQDTEKKKKKKSRPQHRKNWMNCRNVNRGVVRCRDNHDPPLSLRYRN